MLNHMQASTRINPDRYRYFRRWKLRPYFLNEKTYLFRGKITKGAVAVEVDDNINNEKGNISRHKL